MPAPRSPTSTPSIRRPIATTREAWSSPGLIEREATEHGAVVIDMMIGANLTKSLFATEELTNTRLSVVNPHRLRARASDLWVRTARAIAASARSVTGVDRRQGRRSRRLPRSVVTRRRSPVGRVSARRPPGPAPSRPCRRRGRTARTPRPDTRPRCRALSPRSPTHAARARRFRETRTTSASGRTRTAWCRPAAAIRASTGSRLRRSRSSAPRADRQTQPRAGPRPGSRRRRGS